VCGVISEAKFFLADSQEFRTGVLYENLSRNSECRGGRFDDSPASLPCVNDFCAHIFNILGGFG